MRRGGVLRYKGRVGPSRFSSWLQATQPRPRRLGWCHVCDAFALRGIIEAGELSPSACRVFGEPLLYFSYGRPAYRSRDGSSMRTNARAPVVVLCDASLADVRARVFPFDTGAFADNRYAPWIHRKMQLSDFEITHLPEAPQRYVQSMFGSNRAYLSLIPSAPPADSYIGQLEVDAMVSMLTDTDAASADDRRLALELQVREPVPFQSPVVRGIIAPQCIVGAPYLEKFLAGAGVGVDVMVYPDVPLKLARDYQTLLRTTLARCSRNGASYDG
jgi:hypothetical protein